MKEASNTAEGAAGRDTQNRKARHERQKQRLPYNMTLLLWLYLT